MMKAESVLFVKLPSTSTTARKVGVLPVRTKKEWLKAIFSVSA
jgi:hypothetical protein